MFALQAPQTGSADTIEIAGAAGDQFCRFTQRVFAGIAVLGQAHDQILLGARADQMLQVIILGALIGFQCAAQSLVLGLQLLQCRCGFLGGWLFKQVTAQQFLCALLVTLAQFDQLAATTGGMQPVAHLITPLGVELLLDFLMQLQSLCRIHQAGVRGADQAA